MTNPTADDVLAQMKAEHAEYMARSEQRHREAMAGMQELVALLEARTNPPPVAEVDDPVERANRIAKRMGGEFLPHETIAAKSTTQPHSDDFTLAAEEAYQALFGISYQPGGFCPGYGHTPHMTTLLELARRGAEIGAARERENLRQWMTKEAHRSFIASTHNASNGEG